METRKSPKEPRWKSVQAKLGGSFHLLSPRAGCYFLRWVRAEEARTKTTANAATLQINLGWNQSSSPRWFFLLFPLNQTKSASFNLPSCDLGVEFAKVFRVPPSDKSYQSSRQRNQYKTQQSASQRKSWRQPFLSSRRRVEKQVPSQKLRKLWKLQKTVKTAGRGRK